MKNRKGLTLAEAIVYICIISFIAGKFTENSTTLNTETSVKSSTPIIKSNAAVTKPKAIEKVISIESSDSYELRLFMERKVSQLFDSSEEPTTFYTHWLNKEGHAILALMVADDGSRREGYAGYVCLTINEPEFKGVFGNSSEIVIAILDINEPSRILGQIDCIPQTPTEVKLVNGKFVEVR